MPSPNDIPAMKARQWKPGQSGNPAGISHKVKEVRDLCQSFGPDVIKRLGEIALHSEDLRAVIEASRVLLARGYGKEREAEGLDMGADAESRLPDVDLKVLPDAAIDEIEAVFKKYAP